MEVLGLLLALEYPALVSFIREGAEGGCMMMNDGVTKIMSQNLGFPIFGAAALTAASFAFACSCMVACRHSHACHTKFNSSNTTAILNLVHVDLIS
jgi:hypothetical protein